MSFAEWEHGKQCNGRRSLFQRYVDVNVPPPGSQGGYPGCRGGPERSLEKLRGRGCYGIRQWWARQKGQEK